MYRIYIKLDRVLSNFKAKQDFWMAAILCHRHKHQAAGQAPLQQRTPQSEPGDPRPSRSDPDPMLRHFLLDRLGGRGPRWSGLLSLLILGTHAVIPELHILSV